MALCIDSTDDAYIAKAKAALKTLAGGVDTAFSYSTQAYRTGGRSVVRVLEGDGIETAADTKPISMRLVRRIIDSGHWVRIFESASNDCSPDKWLKDQMWSGFKSLVGFSANAGFMRKVTTTGSSAIANWSGNDDSTANLSPGRVIAMEPAPAYILLAHELIHGDRIGRGMLQMVRCNSTFVVDQRQDPASGAARTHLKDQTAVGCKSGTIIRGGAIVNFNGTQISNTNNVLTDLTAGQIWADGSMELAEEVATVGLSDDDNTVSPDPLRITENMIRAEHGVNKRLKYGRFNKTLVM